MNSIELLTVVHQYLLAKGIDNWVFGGWAEELYQLREPGWHSDIDLLVRDHCFTYVDNLLESDGTLVDIPEKRFSHKRAFEYHSIRVELFLVDPVTLTTNFFADCHLFKWPVDTFHNTLKFPGLGICSKTALQAYREVHKKIVAKRKLQLMEFENESN
ncbi:hypothetical protein H0A36_13995 [Endozoicomonas sp. SM1973]|uniref:Aminoglycoside-2''-adenylyltransferase n=1 Tax=Spartinivicinus marinus TaxID=2994442 RepID=A0A853I902_9GAMM|nr:hypothetical protein [Spartinivicinus marinus]MCX4028606.1 hypothetical protein [Spartinivicinus marinus]NYZ67128.1 hypothetical protein [Spartinivicinus marinus]